MNTVDSNTHRLSYHKVATKWIPRLITDEQYRLKHNWNQYANKNQVPNGMLRECKIFEDKKTIISTSFGIKKN